MVRLSDAHGLSISTSMCNEACERRVHDPKLPVVGVDLRRSPRHDGGFAVEDRARGNGIRRGHGHSRGPSAGSSRPQADEVTDHRRRSGILDTLQDRRDVCRRARRCRGGSLRHLGAEDWRRQTSRVDRCPACGSWACAAPPTCSDPDQTAHSGQWLTSITRR